MKSTQMNKISGSLHSESENQQTLFLTKFVLSMDDIKF